MTTDTMKDDGYAALKVYRASWSGFVAVGFFSFFVNFGALVSPIYMQQIFDRVMQSRHVETLIYMTVIVVFFLAVIAVLDAIRGSLLAHIARWWDDTVHSDLVVAIVQMARAKGVAQSHAIGDLMTIRQFVGGPGVLPFFDGPWIPLFLFAITMIHPWLGIVALTAAILLFGVAVLTDRVTRRRMEGLGSRQARAQATIDIATRHADSVYSMGMLPGIMARFNEDNSHVAEAMFRVANFTAKAGAVTKFIRFSAQIAVLGLGAYLATIGEMTPGGIIAASIILGRALAPAEQAMGAWRGLIAAILAHRRIREIFLVAPVDKAKTRQPDPRGMVEFRNACFMLRGSERAILQNINLTFPPESVVAVIGSSGSGKSTLCRMLIGALEPTSGSVRLDGVAIRNWDKEQLGTRIGYLSQSVQLLDGTIKENIARMGAPDDAAVVEAALIAGCHDMINRFPQGYDTVIGSTGINLSGGQAQRIGLARAIYGRPRLVVLDEPNSNLDAEGDEAFQDALIKLRDLGTTVVVVSHRPSILTKVDLTVTIKDGMVDKVQTREDFLKSASEPVTDLLKKLSKAKAGQKVGSR